MFSMKIFNIQNDFFGDIVIPLIDSTNFLLLERYYLLAYKKYFSIHF